MGMKDWEQQKADRAERRRQKQEAWAARNRKHQPIAPELRSKLPKPKENRA